MRCFLFLGMIALAIPHPAIAQTLTTDLAPKATVVPTATITLTVKVNVPELLTASYTCVTPDPSGDGSCDISPDAAVGTPVFSFKITGAPAAYVGTPTFTESTNSLKLSGNNVVTAASPLTASSYSTNIVGSQ